jgi:hypothetical protein
MSRILRSSAGRVAAVLVICVAVAALGLGRVAPAKATGAAPYVALGQSGFQHCMVGIDDNCESATTAIELEGTSFNGEAFSATNGSNGDGVDGIALNDGDGLGGESLGNGDGVSGISDGTGSGLKGLSTGSGYGLFVKANEATGGHIETPSQTGAGLEVNINNAANARGAVEAETTGDGPGVQGQSDFGGPGVKGVGLTRGGYGVFGQDNSAGSVGLYGTSTKGLALEAHGNSKFTGKTTFARSGTVTVASGKSSVAGPAVNLTPASLVLATIQGNVHGVWIQGVTLTTGTHGSFTVHLNKTAPSKITVAWFIAN